MAAMYLCKRTAAAATAAIRQGARTYHVCQTGFNRGRSAIAFLSAAPSVTVVSFDLGSHGYVEVADEWIRASFGQRHSLYVGDSRTRLPSAIAHGKLAHCDLIFVDGSHVYDGAMDDVMHFGWVSPAGTPLLMDDCPSMMGTAFRCERQLSLTLTLALALALALALTNPSVVFILASLVR